MVPPDEVLPLAEHAMACPAWRLTPAQVSQGERLRPALIWDCTDDEDVLSSNGAPGWYDQTGDLHSASAWTWRHTATGRSDRPEVGDADRFWPLSRRYRGGRHPLIKQLRMGAEQGGHWLVVDTDPARAAGRDRFQVLDHRDEIAPPDARWIPAQVTAAAVWYGEYPALIAEDYTIGGEGDVIARFDQPTVQRMVADLQAVHASTDHHSDPMPGEVAALHLDREVLTVSWSHDDGHHEHWADIDRVHPDDEGYYPVGAYLWPWRTVESPTGPD